VTWHSSVLIWIFGLLSTKVLTAKKEFVTVPT
jgi:hypothetical protein